MINMTQPNFDYMTINSDSEEEDNFKDKFSVITNTNVIECNICLETFNNNFTFFKCRKCIFQTCPQCFCIFHFEYNFKICPFCKR